MLRSNTARAHNLVDFLNEQHDLSLYTRLAATTTLFSYTSKRGGQTSDEGHRKTNKCTTDFGIQCEKFELNKRTLTFTLHTGTDFYFQPSPSAHPAAISN